MASSNEFVQFVGEAHLDDDPFGTTSKKAGRHLAGPSRGRRWSQQQAAAAASRRLVDEEDDKGQEEEEASSWVRGKEG
ncbi:UNVERIFIED_CONTAM: hypothetical protein Sradi_6141900 [Sesamum radiatum]|uniref:Uncharacterized protein n=1 Tax=Sesamum radiatum TaxID=300843 RepID=A0AAW2KK93_SESRA